MAPGVTANGLREAIAAVQQLPEAVTNRFKAVAEATANRIAENARRNLLSKTRAVKTAASIVVQDQTAKKQFNVHVPGDPSDDPKLAFWLETGTRNMPAKPYLRPAGDAESQRYRQDMTAAATAVISGVVK